MCSLVPARVVRDKSLVMLFSGNLPDTMWFFIISNVNLCENNIKNVRRGNLYTKFSILV